MFPAPVVRTRFPTQNVRGQGYPGGMVNRARMRGPPPRPASHNPPQSRVGGAGSGMPGMGTQRVNAIPAPGPRKQNYRPQVNPSGAGQQSLANSGTSQTGITIPVSRTLPKKYDFREFKFLGSCPNFILSRLSCPLNSGQQMLS